MIQWRFHELSCVMFPSLSEYQIFLTHHRVLLEQKLLLFRKLNKNKLVFNAVVIYSRELDASSPISPQPPSFPEEGHQRSPKGWTNIFLDPSRLLIRLIFKVITHDEVYFINHNYYYYCFSNKNLSPWH